MKKKTFYKIQAGLPPVYAWATYDVFQSIITARKYVKNSVNYFGGKRIRILKVVEEVVK